MLPNNIEGRTVKQTCSELLKCPGALARPIRYLDAKLVVVTSLVLKRFASQSYVPSGITLWVLCFRFRPNLHIFWRSKKGMWVLQPCQEPILTCVVCFAEVEESEGSEKTILA